MYTGEAGGSPMDLQKQWEKEKWQISSNGPMMLDFYRLLTAAQGSMGIVSWASLKCDILPKIHKLFFVPAQRQEELNDFVSRIVRLRFGDELLILNGSYLAYLLGESVEQISELQDKLPNWVAIVGIAGREMLPEERVEAQEKDITEIAQEYGLNMISEISGVKGEEALKKIIEPSSNRYWKETYKGASQDIFFVTTLYQTTNFIAKMYSLAQAAEYPIKDIGIYIQPQHIGSSYHLEFNLPYNTQSSQEVDRMKKLFSTASEEFSRMGAYFARPYGIWARLQLNKDAQSYITLKKLKGIFDPHNVMNPGKLTI
jgi:FAD/FMN-containing dehydrogenase